MLDNILGGTSSSRLFQEVREKRGLAYSVYSFQSLYAGSGQIGLYLGTRPDNVARALGVVADELERFRAEPATAEELERSKENVKGRVLLALESTTARMNRLGSSVLADMPLLSVDEVEERIDAVGARRPRRAGRRAAGARAPERGGHRRRRVGLPRGARAGLGGARGVIRVGVAGAAGRMGSAVCEAVEGADDLELAGRADPAAGRRAGRHPRRLRRRRRLHDARRRARQRAGLRARRACTR